jgi:hypothetical protein
VNEGVRRADRLCDLDGLARPLDATFVVGNQHSCLRPEAVRQRELTRDRQLLEAFDRPANLGFRLRAPPVEPEIASQPPLAVERPELLARLPIETHRIFEDPDRGLGVP